MIFGILALLIALTLVVLILSYRQVQQWLYPPRNPIQPQPVDSPFTAVTFQTEDGLTIYGWYAPGESGQVILMFHGHGGNRDVLLVHADYLLDSGYGLLLVDFRNRGDSDGDLTSMGYNEIKDARSAYNFLMSQDDVEQIVIWGHSMGGAVASRLMSEVDADGLIVDATFTDFPAVVRTGVIARGLPPTPITEILLMMYGVIAGIDWDDVRPIENMASIDKPILLLHGSDDPVIPVDNAYQLAGANPNVNLIVIEGGGHSDLLVIEPEQYLQAILTYLDQVWN